MAWLKKGSAFLSDFSEVELKKLCVREKNVKAKLRLLAVIQRKRGDTLEAIAFSLQKPKTTIHDWLQRFESAGMSKLYDVKQPGKSAKIMSSQLEKLGRMLDESPEKQNIPFTIWTTKLVQYVLQKDFGETFGVRHVRRIIKQLHFSLQIPRPANRKANKRLQEKFKVELKKKFNIMLNLDSRSSALTKRTSS